MAYEVITQGGGEGLSYTFNAVAALFNGSKGLGASLVYIAGSFATALAVMTLVIKQELLPSFKWFFGSLMMITALMVPKVDILIKDRITGFETPVANVPFMLGAFAGVASQLGDVIAERFDSLFSKAGGEVMNYRKHGVAMASQLAAKATHFTIANPDQAANVKSFVQNCMVFDIAKGKYTVQELVNAPDTWEFLKKHASPIRGFPYRLGKGKTKILTCEEVVSGEEVWKSYVMEAAKRYGPEFFPHHSSKKAAIELLANIELSYQYLTGLSVDAASILKQSMMRNAIREGLLEANQLHDSSAAITAYAVSRAEAQQKTAYALQGKMASLSLSTLKIVIEVLFYGMFPMIVAISIFPGGLKLIQKYLIALFWIQSWAPMYSLLNMLVNVYGKAKSVAAVTLADGSKTLAFSTLPRLGEANEWVSAVAGYAMMSVPFLSYGIIHYGAGALSQLATHFGSQTQSAASHAAEEATTGNYHIGNTSFDNHNRSNVNAFKYDTNTSIAAGKSSVQGLDGAQLNRMADGSHTINREAAISKLGAVLNVGEGMSSNLSEGAELSHRAGLQHGEQAISGRAAALSQFKEARENRAQDKSSGEIFTTNESVMQDSGLSKNLRIAEEIEKRFGVNKELAGRIVAGIRAEAGGGVNFGVAKASINAYATAEGSFSRIDSEKLDEALRYAQDRGASENWRQAETEAKEGRYATLDSKNQSSGKAMVANLSESVARQNMATASFNEEQAYRKSAQVVENKGAQFNQDMSQAFFNTLIKNHNLEEANRIVSNPELLRKHASGWIQTQAETLKEGIKAQGVSLSPETIKQQYDKNVQAVERGNTPDSAFEDYQKTVSINTDKDLNNPINTQAKDKFNNKEVEVKAIIRDGTSDISSQKEQLVEKGSQFKKRNSTQESANEGKDIYDSFE